MANEELTIAQNKARLSIIGKSRPDDLTNSGDGLDLTDIILEELDLPLDIDDLIVGLDDNGDPILIYIDDGLPVTVDLDIDWDDFIDNFDYSDLLFDIDLTGLNDLFWLDDDFNIQDDDLPTSIAVVFPPDKTEYTQGQAISKAGLYVYAYKSDGTVWRGSERVGDKYVSGRVPNDEITLESKVADLDETGNSWIPINFSGPGVYAAFAGNQDRVYDVAQAVPVFCGYFMNSWAPGRYEPFAIALTPISGKHQGSSITTYDGGRFYFMDGYGWGDYSSEAFSCAGAFMGTLPFGSHRETILSAIGAVGGEEDKQIITVSWARPVDGRVLTAHFEITVKPGGGGGR